VDLVFTRAKFLSSSSDSTKDAQCVAELGPGYRAATPLDIQALYRSNMFGSPNFTVAASSTAVQVTVSDPYLFLASTAQALVQIACTKLSAPLGFTRTMISSSSSDATKDAQCVAELGPGYRAATPLDIQALYRSNMFGSPNFTVAASSTAVQVTVSNPYLFLASTAQALVQVACARF
jgi:hypothetical protein